MAISATAALMNALLDTGSFKGVMADGFIYLYAGTVPADAEASIGAATQLCKISVSSGGTGIEFEASASGGVLAKAAAETWSGVNDATGVATFFRHVDSSDDPTGTVGDEIRYQGTCGQGNGDMNLVSTSLTISATTTINHHSVVFPV